MRLQSATTGDTCTGMKARWACPENLVDGYVFRNRKRKCVLLKMPLMELRRGALWVTSTCYSTTGINKKLYATAPPAD